MDDVRGDFLGPPHDTTPATDQVGTPVNIYEPPHEKQSAYA